MPWTLTICASSWSRTNRWKNCASLGRVSSLSKSSTSWQRLNGARLSSSLTSATTIWLLILRKQLRSSNSLARWDALSCVPRFSIWTWLLCLLVKQWLNLSSQSKLLQLFAAFTWAWTIFLCLLSTTWIASSAFLKQRAISWNHSDPLNLFKRHQQTQVPILKQ